MLENGVDVHFIQAMLGHTSIETTTINTRVSLTKLSAVYERTNPARAARALARETNGERESLLESLDADADEDGTAA